MATLREVAKKAGVSYTQASYVLNERNLHCVSAERQKRVRKAIRELRYRPNAAARIMVNGRFGCVALVLNAINAGRSTLPEHLLAGICSALEERNYHLTVAPLPDEKLASREFFPKILREWTADGMLINYNKDVPPKMVELLEEYNLPSVWINDKRDWDCVHPDDLGAGEAATEHLLRMGHRRIAYASYSYLKGDPHYSELDRAEGYRQAMQAAGLQVVCHDRYDFKPELSDRVDLAHKLLSRPGRPTAVVTYGNSTVTPVYAAARDLGLRVPEDVSLVTFHNVEAMLGVGITTMLVPNFEVGRAAVDMLLKRIEKPSWHGEPRAVPFTLDKARSCARPRWPGH